MTCQHPNCQRTLVIDCIKPELFSLIKPAASPTAEKTTIDFNRFIEYFCPIHCEVHGYCWGCGFHFSPTIILQPDGLCQDCRQKLPI